MSELKGGEVCVCGAIWVRIGDMGYWAFVGGVTTAHVHAPEVKHG